MQNPDKKFIEGRRQELAAMDNAFQKEKIAFNRRAFYLFGVTLFSLVGFFVCMEFFTDGI